MKRRREQQRLKTNRRALPKRSLRFQALEARQMLAGDLGEPHADITGLWVTVGDREYYSSDHASVSVDMLAGETLQITGIQYDLDETFTPADGVIAFESYVRREHGAASVGSYDYTDGRFGDPVAEETLAGQAVSHPGLESGWQLDVIDNRIAVVAIRYFGDTVAIEDRMFIDVNVTEPEEATSWTEATVPIQGDWQIEEEEIGGDSRDGNQDIAGLTVIETDSLGSQRYEVGVKAKTVEENSFANGFVVVDYRGENDFVYAGLRSIADQWVIGHYDGQFNDLATLDQEVEPRQVYDLRVAVDGSHVALAVDGVFRVSHDFDHPLDQGPIGLANQFAYTHFTGFSFFDNADKPNADSGDVEAAFEAAKTAVEKAEQDLEAAIEDVTDSSKAVERAEQAVEKAVRDHEKADQQVAELTDEVAELQQSADDAASLSESVSAAAIAAREAADNAEQLAEQAKGAPKSIRKAAEKEAKKADKFADQKEKDARSAADHAEEASEDLNELNAKLDEAEQQAEDVSLELTAAMNELRLAEAVEAAQQTLAAAELAWREELAAKQQAEQYGKSEQPPTDDSSHVYSLNFNHQNDGAMETVSGRSELVAGQIHLGPTEELLAISVLDNDALPERTATRMYATVRADSFPNPNQNGFIVFDYQSPADFKYAGVWAGADRWAIGEVVDGELVDIEAVDEVIGQGPAYELQIWIQDNTVTLLVEGEQKLQHSFDGPIDDGQLGLANHNARSRFDQVAVMRLYGGAGDIGIEQDINPIGSDPSVNDAAIADLF